MTSIIYEKIVVLVVRLQIVSVARTLWEVFFHSPLLNNINFLYNPALDPTDPLTKPQYSMEYLYYLAWTFAILPHAQKKVTF